MKKVDDLTVKVSYTVSISDIEMPQEVYEELQSAFDEDEAVVINSMERAEAQDWLSQHIKESGCDGWEAEIYIIETE